MVLIIALVAMALLLIASVALFHSSRGTTLLAGNVALKRDLANQSERGFAAAQARLAGPLGSDAARAADALSSNYLSSQFPTNAQGVPTVLVNDSSFAALKLSADADIVDDSAGIRIRYVIDRMCRSSGSFSAEACQSVQMEPDPGGSLHQRRPSGEFRPVYRITVRVTDVRRNTQTFAQQVLRG
jgi:type IV pilus assembly protein PilX